MAATTIRTWTSLRQPKIRLHCGLLLKRTPPKSHSKHNRRRYSLKVQSNILASRVKKGWALNLGCPRLKWQSSFKSPRRVFVLVSSAQTFIVFNPINLIKFINIVNTVHHVEQNKENVWRHPWVCSLMVYGHRPTTARVIIRHIA